MDSLKKYEELQESKGQKRSRAIAQNGNDGLHYEKSETYSEVELIALGIMSEDSREDAIKRVEELMQMEVDAEEIKSHRQFDTGASRDTDLGKLDYEGFLHPRVLKIYAEYMNKNRIFADQKVRDSDNWQKGIPVDVYIKSMWRHFFDVWSNHRGEQTKEDQQTNLSALLFNVMGMLFEISKDK